MVGSQMGNKADGVKWYRVGRTQSGRSGRCMQQRQQPLKTRRCHLRHGCTAIRSRDIAWGCHHALLCSVGDICAHAGRRVSKSDAGEYDAPPIFKRRTSSHSPSTVTGTLRCLVDVAKRDAACTSVMIHAICRYGTLIWKPILNMVRSTREITGRHYG